MKFFERENRFSIWKWRNRTTYEIFFCHALQQTCGLFHLIVSNVISISHWLAIEWETTSNFALMYIKSNLNKMELFPVCRLLFSSSIRMRLAVLSTIQWDIYVTRRLRQVIFHQENDIFTIHWHYLFPSFHISMPILAIGADARDILYRVRAKIRRGLKYSILVYSILSMKFVSKKDLKKGSAESKICDGSNFQITGQVLSKLWVVRQNLWFGKLISNLIERNLDI